MAQLHKDLAELVQSWALKPLVTALQALRGVQLLTAVTIAAEIGDLHRFQSAPQFMAYVGVVPSEYSSGESRRRGRITKTGNAHVRRVLVEAAWCNRRRLVSWRGGSVQLMPPLPRALVCACQTVTRHTEQLLVIPYHVRIYHA